MKLTTAELCAIAHHIGYEWGMLLGAAETAWHVDGSINALGVSKSNPQRVIHLHARTELLGGQSKPAISGHLKTGH